MPPSRRPSPPEPHPDTTTPKTTGRTPGRIGRGELVRALCAASARPSSVRTRADPQHP
ncbi:hypothetical protein ARHIZOSPH14_15600 [Agromyces rhizosphaerae]|uniref:Uncharacterized protein n=1 Tax=Agromyces rhizosphaerae TaxID=88374 RepID=A0A9W6FRP3_9MICO|nr:hypothetical protein ARHIZOSPH14_15600 [Agromyces rhizosphaerae]